MEKLSFDARYSSGQTLEDHVSSLFRRYNIFHEKLGAKHRSPLFNSRLLKDGSPVASVIRYQPDFYVYGEPSALIDVKNSIGNMPNNALEIAAWNHYRKLSESFGIDVYLICSDGCVYDVNHLNPHTTIYPDENGVVRGSNTPFVLFSKNTGTAFKHFFSTSRWLTLK